MRIIKVLLSGLAVTLVIFILTPLFCLAAMQVDTTFGESGVAVRDFGFGDDEAFALAIQDDGKIVVAGYAFNGAVKNLAVARYLASGQLDRDFNFGGIVTLSMGSGDTVAGSLALQDDGKIVLAGVAEDGERSLILVRLTPEGNPDKGFGDSGQVVVPFDDGNVRTTELEIAADGRMVVAGILESGESVNHSYFIRIDSQGTLDRSFGESGVTLVQRAGSTEVNAIGLIDDGKVLAAGALMIDSVPNAALLRLKQDGTLDESFGEQGMVVLKLEGTVSAVNDIAFDGDGNILVTGYAHDGTNFQTIIGRVDENGMVVSDFGPGGFYRSTLSFWNMGNAIAVQPDGVVLVTGVVGAESGTDIFVITITERDDFSTTSPDVSADGQEQATASVDAQASADERKAGGTNLATATIVVDVMSHDDNSFGVATMKDGKAVVAGSSGNGSDKDFSLIRLSTEAPTAANGEMLAGGGVTTAGYYLVTRLVTDIQPQSASSGGEITLLETRSCSDICAEQCAGAANPTTCTAECLATCVNSPTITKRGVCYSVDFNPEYVPEEVSPTDPTDPTDPVDPNAPDDPGTGNGIFPQWEKSPFDIIRSGCTEDGSGTGEWDSFLEPISPDTRYYVRAYAVLSDDTVIYGNQFIFKSTDSCFIATAAYGSILDSHVGILREFRDKVLMSSRVGQQLVGFYYHFSPSLAAVIDANDGLRAAVRVVLWPVVFSAFVLLHAGQLIPFCLLVAAAGFLFLSFKPSRRI